MWRVLVSIWQDLRSFPDEAVNLQMRKNNTVHSIQSECVHCTHRVIPVPQCRKMIYTCSGVNVMELCGRLNEESCVPNSGNHHPSLSIPISLASSNSQGFGVQGEQKGGQGCGEGFKGKPVH